VRNKL